MENCYPTVSETFVCLGFCKFQPMKPKGLESRRRGEVVIAGIGKCLVHAWLEPRPDSGGKVPL